MEFKYLEKTNYTVSVVLTFLDQVVVQYAINGRELVRRLGPTVVWFKVV